MLNTSDSLPSAVRATRTDGVPRAAGVCPDLQGTYEERGRFVVGTASGRPCSDDAGECTSLSFALLQDAHVTLGRGGGTVPADSIRVMQPSSDRLEIVVLPDGPARSLSMQAGDFSCDADGLSLRETTDQLVVVISNVHSSEVRTFDRAEDGALLMLSRWRNRGHHTFMTFDVSNEELVRWEPSPGAGQPAPR
jgi:hypothetical protein